MLLFKHILASEKIVTEMIWLCFVISDILIII